MVKTLQTIRYIRYIYLTVFAGSPTTAVFNSGLLSYHALSEGVLLSEILSEHCLMVDFQKYFIRDWSWYLPHVAKRRGSLGLDREWRDWVTGAQREKNAKAGGNI